MGRQTCLGKHISYLFHVDFKGAKRLTLWTGTSFHLLVLGLEKGSQDEAALAAVVFDHAELRQDPCATRHYSAGADQLIQVQLPEERREMLDACRAQKAEHPTEMFLLQGTTPKGLVRNSYQQESSCRVCVLPLGTLEVHPLSDFFSCNKLSHPVGLNQSFSLQTSSPDHPKACCKPHSHCW